MQKNYRHGAIGALLDEYERAISELKEIVETIPDDALIIVVDPRTNDENCRSVQTVLSHVVNSGYGYATSIYNLKGHNMMRPAKTFHVTTKEYIDGLCSVFAFTENVLGHFNDNELEQKDNALKLTSWWGQLYDIEQMMEHAIVHILRHRRQLERFKLLM